MAFEDQPERLVGGLRVLVEMIEDQCAVTVGASAGLLTSGIVANISTMNTPRQARWFGQIGVLYHDYFAPGSIMPRNTGAVHFTIWLRQNNNGADDTSVPGESQREQARLEEQIQCLDAADGDCDTEDLWLHLFQVRESQAGCVKVDGEEGDAAFDYFQR